MNINQNNKRKYSEIVEFSELNHKNCEFINLMCDRMVNALVATWQNRIFIFFLSEFHLNHSN